MAEDPEKLGRAFIRPLAEADYQLGIASITRPLRVFVAGPYIERGWSPEERAERAHAARRRIDLIEHVEGVLQHQAILGEHRGVAEIGEKRLRSRASAAATELKLVRDNCDAVVILPSSPGSFCELGTWSIYKDVCEKMLIIADKQFEAETGYLAVGAFKTACDHGAKLAWVEYQDKDGVIGAADRHIEYMQDAVAAKAIFNV